MCADCSAEPTEEHMNGRVALVIPTRNAGPGAAAVIAGIHSQKLQPDSWLVIDSGS
jgi:glycosyltransferase involved in cell wall biosynthesis